MHHRRPARDGDASPSALASASLAASRAPATPSAPRTPPPTPARVEAEVLGFLPNWLVEAAAATIDTDILTLLAFHGVEASGDGRLVTSKPSGEVPTGWQALDSEAFVALKARAQAEGVRVILTIQRFGWVEGNLDRTRALLESRQDRRALAERIARLVSERGFDGVNLDFEPVPEELADEYVAFVREVRAALDAVEPGLHISVDVLPSLSGYDLPGLVAADAADLAVIMGYNFRTDGAPVAGSTAPLDDPEIPDIVASLDAATVLVPPEKLVLALPWFGAAWSTETDQPGSPTMSGRGIDGGASPSYAEAVALAGQTGRNYDQAQASAWTAYPNRQCATCPATWRQAWYDDPDGFGAKVDQALSRGLAGVGIWALGQEADREELWWTLRHRLRPQVDQTPPAGSASVDPESIRGDLEGLDVVEGVASLRLFATDTPEGSGLVLTRIGLAGPELTETGELVTGRTYPASERIEFPLGDESTGGSSEPGPRSIHVQWRDVAGNWSPPIVVEAWVVDPARSQTPEDL
jgi:GH18 family chitinase